jgi:hypothetical protein
MGKHDNVNFFALVLMENFHGEVSLLSGNNGLGTPLKIFKDARAI